MLCFVVELLKMNDWHQIHDALYGWGMRECILGNDVLDDTPTPLKILSSKEPAKRIWLNDAYRYLKIENIFTMSSEELYDLYDKLQPYIEKHLEWLRSQPTRKFDRITIPKINREWPKL